MKKGSIPLSLGFAGVMPWVANNADDRLPSNIKTGDDFTVTDVKINERKTSPPDYLSEADLISLMEKHGIGTDASIPTHINNICQRNYVKVESGRRLIPTRLGIVLVHGYQKIDRSLVLPTSRAEMEKELNEIASGKRQFREVLKNTLDEFRKKFLFFRDNINAMDELFQVSFSSLADSGKPLSKCGHCKRFMKYISAKPIRLYCPNCNNTLSLPHTGSFRPHKEMVCPHDNFDLLYCNAGVNGKSFVLCPLCYNNPPFEGMTKNSGCNNCTNSECGLSRVQTAVAPCKGCRFDGQLVPDPGSGPTKWRIRCNQCLFILEGFDKASEIIVDAASSCESCKAKIVRIVYKADGKELKGCIFCSKDLSNLWITRIGERFQDLSISGKKGKDTASVGDQSNGKQPGKQQIPNKTSAAPKYDPNKDPNADEFVPRGRGRGGRGGRRGGRGRGGRGRGRGGRGGGRDTGDGNDHGHFTGMKLSDFL